MNNRLIKESNNFLTLATHAGVFFDLIATRFDDDEEETIVGRLAR